MSRPGGLRRSLFFVLYKGLLDNIRDADMHPFQQESLLETPHLQKKSFLPGERTSKTMSDMLGNTEENFNESKETIYMDEKKVQYKGLCLHTKLLALTRNCCRFKPWCL